MDFDDRVNTVQINQGGFPSRCMLMPFLETGNTMEEFGEAKVWIHMATINYGCPEAAG